MNDDAFLREVQKYIEVCEVNMEAEYNKGLSLNELLSQGKMPQLYYEVLRRLAQKNIDMDGQD